LILIRKAIIHFFPLTLWNEKKAKIKTTVVIEPTSENGLTKLSVVDCLQTRPVDIHIRMEKILGKISTEKKANY